MGNGKTPVAHSLQEAKIGSFEGDEALHQRIDRRRDLRQGILSGGLMFIYTNPRKPHKH